MQPDIFYFLFVCVFDGAFGQDAGNTFAAILRVDCDVGDQINTLMIISKWDKAGIANDPSIFLPDET